MASGNNMKAAESTYQGFITLLKVGTAVSVLVTALVVILIA